MSNKKDSSALEDLNIIEQLTLFSPEVIKNDIPLTDKTIATIISSRRAVTDVIHGKDKRVLVVVGPCSIHDIDAAKEYGERLQKLAIELQDNLLLVMRVYFEKPRTTVGWKGLINDPLLNGSFNIEEGLRIGRQLLFDLVNMGLPLATEALDPITPQYLHDLIAWSVIGARTAESQTHREMASGLSSPVGIKNSTDGSLDVALNALNSVSQPHCFLGANRGGQLAILKTRGNPTAHVVLRGGNNMTNYDSESVAKCIASLKKANLNTNIMIDCSHANSQKNHIKQYQVALDVGQQIAANNKSIIGIMMESNLFPGRQEISSDPSTMKYGVSVTDACMGWQETVDALHKISSYTAQRNRKS